jgi:glycosyltransferase involved in cell wall biosynthesis
MKLLFYIHGITGGGAERVMATLMNSFIDKNYHVRVVYTSSTENSVYTLDSRIEEVFMLNNCRRKSSKLIDKIYRKIWKYFAIRKEAKKYNPDFVISFIRTQNNDVLLSLLGSGFPVIVGDHTNVNRKYPFITSTLTRILYPSACAITMLTKCDYNKWKDKYKHVYYIPNPCDLRINNNISNREKIVLGVGRVNQWQIKGFDNLIKAWAVIKDKFPDWKCQIAGLYSEESLTELKKQLNSDVFNSVEFIGFRTDIYEYMQSCEVFYLSSRFEGMPMALLEALNLGCACVSFDCNTGPGEMIEHGVNGLLAKDQDVDDLTQKLEELISNESLRNKFHNTSPTSVQCFSTENITTMWINMFYELKKNIKNIKTF